MGLAIPIRMACIARWVTRRLYSGLQRAGLRWPPVRHVWPPFLLDAEGWAVGQSGDIGRSGRNRPGAEKPAGAGTGRAGSVVLRLRRSAYGRSAPDATIYAIRALTAFGLKGLDRVPGLLHRAGDEAADGMPLPGHGLQ